MRLFWKLALAVLTALAWMPILAFAAAVWIANSHGCQVDEGSVHPCAVNGRDIGAELQATAIVAGLTGMLALPFVIGTAVAWIVIWRDRRRAARAVA